MTSSQKPPVIVVPSAPTAHGGEQAAPDSSREGVADAAKNLGRALGRAAGRTAGRAAHGAREGIRRNPTANTVYRTGVGVVGGGTVALGVVLMPLPGPGTLIALGGLGILSTEFDGAKKVRRGAEGAAKKAYGAAKDARARHRSRQDARQNARKDAAQDDARDGGAGAEQDAAPASAPVSPESAPSPGR